MEEVKEEEIPTLEELTATLSGQTDLAHTEDGKWIPTQTKVKRLVCGVCNAPSGQVTLMKIPAEFADKAVDKGITGNYVCLGLNCRKQRDIAINRLVRDIQRRRK